MFPRQTIHSLLIIHLSERHNIPPPCLLVNTETSDWLSSCSRSVGLTWCWSSGATTLSSLTVSSPGNTQAGNWRKMCRQKYSKQFSTRRKRATGGHRIFLSFGTFTQVVLEGRSWWWSWSVRRRRMLRATGPGWRSGLSSGDRPGTQSDPPREKPPRTCRIRRKTVLHLMINFLFSELVKNGLRISGRHRQAGNQSCGC